ncbi:MAG: protease TldD [Acidobacteria bacterium ADurb.Bin051]|nr:MAG: protease TldD [Acidobacteria bacterium ADurb.Bin051]
MSGFGPLEDLLGTLARRGWQEAEAYAKRGRTRRVTLGPGGLEASSTAEEGWAIRASGRQRSLFQAGTGAPGSGQPFAAGEAPPLALPAPQPVPAWTAPPELDAPLVGDSEGQALLEGIARALAKELPGAVLTTAALVDGTSQAWLLSSRGVRSVTRQRLALLRLEARLPGGRGGAVGLERCEREARRFRPQAVARRLADRLLIARDGGPPAPDGGGEIVLAPAVSARLLAALAGSFCGAGAEAALAPLLDRSGRLAAGCVTFSDDGRRPEGPAAAPADGEGLPTCRVVLVEEGVFRQPLLAWWEAREPALASGCVRRDGFRDLPRRAPTHFVLEPNPALAPAELISGVARGYYLLGLEGAPRLDLAADRLAAPVCGFALAGGRAVSPVKGAWLVGSVRDLLAGAVAVGRDLEWQVGDGLFGAPTLLAAGLELQRAPG